MRKATRALALLAALLLCLPGASLAIAQLCEVAATLRERFAQGVDGAVVVPPDDVPAMQRALGDFLDSLAATPDTTRQPTGVERWSRRARAQELAQLLDAVSA